jgi:hypothetical protein
MVQQDANNEHVVRAEQIKHTGKNQLIELLAAGAADRSGRAKLRQELELLSLPALRLKAQSLIPAVKKVWQRGTITEISERGVWVVVHRAQKQCPGHFVGRVAVDESRDAIKILVGSVPLVLAGWSVQYQATATRWVDHTPEISIQILNGIVSPASESVIVTDNGTQYEVGTPTPLVLSVAALKCWAGQQKFYGGLVASRTMLAHDLHSAEREHRAREAERMQRAREKWDRVDPPRLEDYLPKIVAVQRFVRGFLARHVWLLRQKGEQLDAELARMSVVMGMTSSGDADASLAPQARSPGSRQAATRAAACLLLDCRVARSVSYSVVLSGC